MLCTNDEHYACMAGIIMGPRLPETRRKSRPQAEFFKCPTGGFASLLPGVCPKCREPLIRVAGANSSLNEHMRVIIETRDQHLQQGR